MFKKISNFFALSQTEKIFVAVFFVAIFCSAIFLPARSAQAATCTASTGNWSAVGTWSCGHVPLVSDTCVMGNSITLTVDTTATCSSLTWPTSVNGASTLNISGTNSLTITGTTALQRPNTGGTSSLNVGAGDLTTATLTLGGTNSLTSRTTVVSISTGSIHITG